MTSPLHAAYFADQAVQVSTEIVENVCLARDTYRVRFEAPEIAGCIVPGQFLMLRLAGINDPLIGRPLALYDTVLDGAGRPTRVDVVYLAKGKFTSRLCEMRPGQRLDVWGPLGNGFQVEIVVARVLGVRNGIFLLGDLGRRMILLRRFLVAFLQLRDILDRHEFDRHRFGHLNLEGFRRPEGYQKPRRDQRVKQD